MDTLLDWLAIFIILALVAFYARHRSANSEDYLVAGRQIGLKSLVPTLVMTELNIATLLAFSALGYIAGPMALAMPLIFLVGLSWYTITVAKKWKQFDGLSVAQLFTQRYGAGLGRFASILLIVAMIGFSATYIKSMTLVVHALVDISPWLLSLLLVLTAIGMTIRGGLPSVIRADIIGCIICAVIFAWLLYAALSQPSNLASVFDVGQLKVNPIAQWQHPILPWRFVFSLIILTCFTYMCAPWYGQKIFAAKDTRNAYQAVAWSALLVFLLYGCVVLAAAHFKAYNPALSDPQLVLPAMIDSWLPPFARGIGYAALLIAALTTLVGVWSAMTAMIKADLFPTYTNSMSQQRIAMLICALLSWLGANMLVDDILDRLILANIPILALSFALLAGFYWKKANAFGAWASTIFGVVWGAGCFIFIGEEGGYTWQWAVYGTPLIFIVGGICSLSRHSETKAKAEGPTK